MGGIILKQNIIIENMEYHIKGEVDAWETCLWRVTVFGSITRKIDDKTIEFKYEAINRKVYDSRHNEFDSVKSGNLTVIGDLVIIRAINPKYYEEDDPLSNGDLNLEVLFKNN